MKKIYIYMLGLSSLLGFTAMSAETPCETVPDCNALGYTKQVADCSAVAIKCPFDISKVFCVETPILCKPEVGSIYYSDKSCSKTVTAGKFAIGIIFDTNKRLMVALSDAGSTMAWGGYGTSIPGFPDCGSGTQLTCNPNGKANTSTIIAYGKANSISYPAAEYCNNYTTAGTTAGNWYLPSVAELALLYNAKTYVNVSLQLLGKSSLTETIYYWSSNSGNGNNSWILHMYNGGIDGNSKGSNNSVRPVMVF